MNFKSWLLRVPDFRDEVERDAKELPPFFQDLTPQEKDEYLRSVTLQRSLNWACKTSAAAYNMAVVIFLLFLMTNGVQLVGIIQRYLAGQ